MSNDSETAEAFGYTQVKVAEFKYTWIINNFGRYLRIGEGLFSPTFSIDSNDGLTWRLEIHPSVNQKCTDIGLHLKSMAIDKNKPVKVMCKVSFTNEDAVERKDNKESLLFGKSGKVSVDFPSFFTHKDFLNNLKVIKLNKTVKIVCQICATTEIGNFSSQFEIAETDLRNPLELLFENPQFSDVTLSSNGTDFKVHKAILASQSQVFEAMFNANMMEKFNNRVEITDLNEETLRELLRFIYTGKVSNLQEMAEDLLTAADKYALRNLKVTCESVLINKVSINNALSMFTLADMHGANQLRGFVKKFIRIHFQDIVNTAEYNLMVQEHPKLIAELLNTK